MKRIIDRILYDTDQLKLILHHKYCKYYKCENGSYIVQNEQIKHEYEAIKIVDLSEVCLDYLYDNINNIGAISEMIPRNSEVAIYKTTTTDKPIFKDMYFKFNGDSFGNIKKFEVISHDKALEEYSIKNFDYIDQWITYFDTSSIGSAHQIV